MTESEKAKVQWFKNACGWIVFAVDNNIPPVQVLSELQHDIIGLQRETPGFAPRLGDYAKYWKG